MNKKVSIIQRALSLIDPTLIYDGTSANSRNRVAIESAFDHTFNQIIGRHAWSYFIRKRELTNYQNVTDEDNEDFRYTRKFNFPRDFARPLTIVSSYGALDSYTLGKIWEQGGVFFSSGFRDYEIHGNFIYANLDRIFLVYMHNDFDSAYTFGSFDSAFVYGVAAFLAYSIKKNTSLFQGLTQLFDKEILVAVNEDRSSVREIDDNETGYGNRL